MTPVLPAAIPFEGGEGGRNGNPSYLINLNFKLTSPVLQGGHDEGILSLGWIAAEIQAALMQASGNQRPGRLRIDAEKTATKSRRGLCTGRVLCGFP
jgi:hypothetical protein